MSDDRPDSSRTAEDIPASWGFYLLQELRRLEDRSVAQVSALEAKIEALESKVDTKIGALGAKVDTKIDALGRELRQEVAGLRYWSWSAMRAVVIGAAAVLLRGPHL